MPDVSSERVEPMPDGSSQRVERVPEMSVRKLLEAQNPISSLEDLLASMGDVAVAVSGGVDSMTLAVVAGRVLGPHARMVHAVSPAVPPRATARVRRYADREGWRLTVLDAGEFADARYRANPADRCFYCKKNLYAAIAGATPATILSGTNLDDLEDFRPGLEAARRHAVRHLYVEIGLDKNGVRAIARALGLHDLAVLPAAPCLASRIETGIRIEAKALAFVDRAESTIREALGASVVRSRVRADGIEIELDPPSLARLGPEARDRLTRQVEELAAKEEIAGPVRFAPYQMGSAFVRAGPDG